MPHKITMSPCASSSEMPPAPRPKLVPLPPLAAEMDAAASPYKFAHSQLSPPTPASMHMPSPSTSISTLPSSVGPFTPPPYYAPLPPPPFSSQARPLPVAGPHDIHTLLHPTPGRPSPLTWDVICDWRNANLASSSRSSYQPSKPLPIPWETLVTPLPTPQLSLFIDGLPWCLTIKESTPSKGITFYDLLRGIWNALRKTPLPEEWTKTAREEKERATRRMNKRVASETDEAAQKREANAGVRKGDYLRHTVFAGIVVHSNGAWQLLLC